MENLLQARPNEGIGEDRVVQSSTTSSHPYGTAEGSKKKHVSVDMQPNNSYFGSEYQSQRMFPMLPDQLTLSRIVPKISWRAVHILASVSRAWRKAIQHHHVYDARVHSCSTDTHLVHSHIYDTEHYDIEKSYARIALYSIRDKFCYDLPPIPGHNRGVPRSCACLSLDGKLYVLGGAVDLCALPDSEDSGKKPCSSDSSSKVYVLDLAGASHWKECGSMERGRQDFGCAALNGKIYVFGGKHNDGPVRGAEVYDPKENAWSAITPMDSLRFGHKVFVRAEKLVVLGGSYYDQSYACWKANGGCFMDDGSSRIFVHKAEFVEIYDPEIDEWSEDVSLSESTRVLLNTDAIFEAEGKFQSVDPDGICCEADRYGTSPQYYKVHPFTRDCVLPAAAILLNGELVAGVVFYDQFDDLPPDGSAIFQSEGFGTKTTEIDWWVLSRCPGAFDFMYFIQL